ncbi:MAG: hypothetical protein ACQEP3_03160 [Patescibacteria group bacterium]
MKKRIINFITVLGLAVLLGVLFEVGNIAFDVEINSILQGVIVGFLCVAFYNYLENQN